MLFGAMDTLKYDKVIVDHPHPPHSEHLTCKFIHTTSVTLSPTLFIFFSLQKVMKDPVEDDDTKQNNNNLNGGCNMECILLLDGEDEASHPQSHLSIDSFVW